MPGRGRLRPAHVNHTDILCLVWFMRIKTWPFRGYRVALLLGCLLLAVACRGQDRASAHVDATPIPTPSPTATRTVPLSQTIPTYTPTPRIEVVRGVPPGTPTPTPTAQRYAVQAGDTLIGIAARYGIAPAALQAENGIEDPRTLQIGQMLNVPRPVPAAEADIEPLPHAMTRILAAEDGLGFPWIMGVVVNQADVAAERIRVQALLLDDDGNEMTRIQGLTLRNVTHPGAETPFMLRLESQDQSWDSWILSVATSLPAHLGVLDTSLEVLGLEHERLNDRTLRVVGRIRNAGGAAVREPEIVVMVHNPQGQVIGVRVLIPEAGPVAPGGELAFAGLVPVLGEDPHAVVAFAQGFADLD